MTTDLSRLGDCFSAEHLEALRQHLKTLDLPIIPLDPTPDEAVALLSFHGSMLSYLYAQEDLLATKKKKAMKNAERVESEVYEEVAKTNQHLNVSVIKRIVQNNTRVVKAQDDVIAIDIEGARVVARIKALEAQNINLRKIVSVIQDTMRLRLD